MKIIDLRVRKVAIPLNAQLRHNTGVHPGYFLRTILELITNEGVVGLGEVGGGDQRGALLKLKPRLVGMDPFDLEAIKLNGAVDVRSVQVDVRNPSARQQWILGELEAKSEMRKDELFPGYKKQFGLSKTTLERDLNALRCRGLIRIDGEKRTGRCRRV